MIAEASEEHRLTAVVLQEKKKVKAAAKAKDKAESEAEEAKAKGRTVVQAMPLLQSPPQWCTGQ